MARFLIFWIFWTVFFMIINIPVYSVYGLRFGVYFALCGNLAAFLALFTDTFMTINKKLK